MGETQSTTVRSLSRFSSNSDAPAVWEDENSSEKPAVVGPHPSEHNNIDLPTPSARLALMAGPPKATDIINQANKDANALALLPPGPPR